MKKCIVIWLTVHQWNYMDMYKLEGIKNGLRKAQLVTMLCDKVKSK